MAITKNVDRFDGPGRRSDAPTGSLSRFGGISTAVTLDADWHYETLDMGQISDALKIVNSHTAPAAATDGTTWEIDNVGGAPTLAVNVNTFPPNLQITTPAVDTQGYQAQRSVASSNVRTTFNPATLDEFFMYIVCRFTDANNNAATVQQSRFAMGFAPVDTSIMTSVDDFVGMHKADGTGNLNLVSDDDDVSLNVYSNQRTIKNLATGSRTGGPAANIWIGLGVQAVIVSQANNLGVLHGFYDVGKRSGFGNDADNSHAGSMPMVEVPDVPLAASLAFVTGEAVAKVLSISKIIVGGKYRLGQA